MMLAEAILRHKFHNVGIEYHTNSAEEEPTSEPKADEDKKPDIDIPMTNAEKKYDDDVDADWQEVVDIDCQEVVDIDAPGSHKRRQGPRRDAEKKNDGGDANCQEVVDIDVLGVIKESKDRDEVAKGLVEAGYLC
ncbi:hypothetical protein R1sor_027263 [Riccia sorocarpa]|uniref:Uncharacterized protein n=1 Tax=Riccia sorocarpa TaxID=122646 RepID=A0ABD3GGV2_9MARC